MIILGIDPGSVITGYAIIKKNNSKNYMEIGVSWGHAFLTINAQRKIGVDPKNLLPVHRFTRDLDTWLLESKKAYRLIRQMLGLENIFFFEQTSGLIEICRLSHGVIAIWFEAI